MRIAEAALPAVRQPKLGLQGGTANPHLPPCLEPVQLSQKDAAPWALHRSITAALSCTTSGLWGGRVLEVSPGYEGWGGPGYGAWSALASTERSSAC